jgi:hypothetical protein
LVVAMVGERKGLKSSWPISETVRNGSWRFSNWDEVVRNGDIDLSDNVGATDSHVFRIRIQDLPEN